MKKIIPAALSGLLALTPAYANESILSEDVVVTASRIALPRDSVLADVTVIGREDIERAGQSTLVELLQRQPGVEISSNGGAGKSSSVFLRGTNAGHVVVLVDGLRVNSATLGTFSFESMPLGQIERIEILRGPAASLYGADAIGGVIQIFTRRGAGAPRFHVAAGYGRYNTRQGEAGVAGSEGGLRYAIHLSGLATDGFSAKKVNTGPDRDHDPYRNLAASANLGYEYAPGHELEMQFFASEGESDYDCNKPVCNIDQTLKSHAITSRNQFTARWLSTLRFGVGVDDATDNTSTSRSVFRTEQRQYLWQNDFTLPLGTLTLAYDRLEQEVDGTTAYAVKSRDNNGWLVGFWAESGAHALQLNLRHDDNSQFGNHTTGNIGYGYRLADHWRLSAGYGTAFKAPTFNQLYFPSFGDPELNPEKSRNREAALRYQDAMLQGSVTLFRNDIRDLIEFSGPVTAGCTWGGFCPVNVGEARITGATVEAGWQIDASWKLGGNLTVQSPRNEDTDKLLSRRGRRHGTLHLDYAQGPFRAGLEVVGNSERYNNAANTKRMGGYALVNLTASHALHRDWRLEARADNVLDKDYVLAYTGNSPASAPYGTPGASLFLGLRWQPQ